MDGAIREGLLGQIRAVVGDRFAFADPYEMRLYQYDASPETALPDIVVIPGTAKEVAQVVKMCADAGVWVALNLLTFPGYSDCSGEVDASMTNWPHRSITSAEQAA